MAHSLPHETSPNRPANIENIAKVVPKVLPSRTTHCSAEISLQTFRLSGIVAQEMRPQSTKIARVHYPSNMISVSIKLTDFFQKSLQSMSEVRTAALHKKHMCIVICCDTSIHQIVFVVIRVAA